MSLSVENKHTDPESKKGLSGRRIFGFVLLGIAAVLIVLAVIGYIMAGSGKSVASLDDMRTQAVLHAASDGLVDSIVAQARQDKLKELRGAKDFRSRGQDAINAELDAAGDAARAEAEALYANPTVEDRTGLFNSIESLESALRAFGTLKESERGRYSELYVKLVDSVGDWTDLTGKAGDDDEKLFSLLTDIVPELGNADNAHLKPAFIRLCRDMSDKEHAREEAEIRSGLVSAMAGAVGDFSALEGLDDDALWEELIRKVPEIEGNERFRDDLLAEAKRRAAAAASGETVEETVKDEGADTVYETQTDYTYFAASDQLKKLEEDNEAAFGALWGELVTVIPDLNNLSSKLQKSMRTSIEDIVWPGSDDFATRYATYTGETGDKGIGFSMKLPASAEKLLVGGIALMLLGLVLVGWNFLTSRFGVPRTIITLFFLYLCLAAVLYDISLPMMMGDILVRMGMYGILVLAMMPGIQSGIGLNMGMTIGCIAGLLGVVMSLQFNMTGFPGLIFACLVGMVVAVPLGIAYSKLLNRMKGSEMTISTYVGFSFVALMCIGWMMLPFNNPKIIWLLSGHGLRVTHSLLNSYAHILDGFLAFEVLGVKVPTGLLLVFLLCCFVMWLFSRSRTGIAMTAAGSNPRFAEASGISVDRMRTIGTTLSTVIAAVGIVIYSQAFGYAQLYNAPRQLGFIAASAILIGGATVRKARVGHVIFGVFLFEGVLVLGQQIANSAVAGGGLSEVMRIMISNGIILYALTQSGGASRE